MKNLIIFALLFFQAFSYGKDYILKVKGDKALVLLSDSDFYEIGDKFSVKDEVGDVVGKASLIKIKENNKAVVKFVGEVQKGYEIFERSAKINETRQNLSNYSYERRQQRYPSSSYRNQYENYKEMSTGRYVGGGITSLFISLGIGHAIQGRYKEKGWIFTITSIVTGIGLVSSLETGDQDVVAGWALLWFGVRIWEAIDVWVLPSSYKLVSLPPKESFTLDTHSNSYFEKPIKLDLFSFHF